MDINPFFRKLYELFPIREFMIYDDSGRGNGPYIFYPKYNDWKEYKKGYKLGIKMRNKKYKKDINKVKKKFSNMPNRKNIDIYKLFLTISGFYEGFGDGNEDIIGKTSWTSIRKSIKEDLELLSEDMYNWGANNDKTYVVK